MFQKIINTYNNNSIFDIKNTLKSIYNNAKPIFICIGTDSCVGDSLGPLIGSFINDLALGKFFSYGNLDSPITSKEINFINNEIKNIHPNCTTIAIDAAVGNKEDIGLIKITNNGIKPGLGANKNLDLIGDYSIIGIVAEKNSNINNFINNTRLNIVHKMSTIISKGIIESLN